MSETSNPFTADLDGTIAGELIADGVSAEDALILKNVISQSDNRGGLKLYNKVVQRVLFALIKAPLVKELKAEAKKKEEEDKQKKDQRAQNAADVAARMVE